MPFELIPYSVKYLQQWDEFVRQDSRNGTIFHEQEFLRYHPLERFSDKSILILYKKKIVGALTAALVLDEDKSARIVSHPGSSGGGLIFSRSATLRDVLTMLDMAIQYYQEQGCNTLEFRLAEPIFSFPTDSELTYLLWHRGFKLKTREVSSCVNLETEDNWLNMVSKRKRQSMRNWQKRDYRIELTENRIEDSYHLIERNLMERFSKKPTHSLQELQDLKQRYRDRIDIWQMWEKQALAATAIVFQVNNLAVHIFYFHVNYSHTDHDAQPALYRSLYSYYCERGFRWLNIGISSRDDWIKWGILSSKEAVGARATHRDVWHLQDLQSYQPYRDSSTEEAVWLTAKPS